MVPTFKLLKGLPPYGPLALAFPSEWGRQGREGVVVQFDSAEGSWVGNFGPGLGGLNALFPHPNGHDALVIAAGNLWVVNPQRRSAELVFSTVDMALEVRDPNGWVFSRQSIALTRFGPEGLIWHTRRLSWDGFDQLRIEGEEVTGLAWSPIDGQWHAFRVDLRTGRSSGGTYSQIDSEQWEKIQED